MAFWVLYMRANATNIYNNICSNMAIVVQALSESQYNFLYICIYVMSLPQEIHWRGRETQLVAPASWFHSRVERPAPLKT